MHAQIRLWIEHFKEELIIKLVKQREFVPVASTRAEVMGLITRFGVTFAFPLFGEETIGRACGRRNRVVAEAVLATVEVQTRIAHFHLNVFCDDVKGTCTSCIQSSRNRSKNVNTGCVVTQYSSDYSEHSSFKFKRLGFNNKNCVYRGAHFQNDLKLLSIWKIQSFFNRVLIEKKINFPVNVNAVKLFNLQWNNTQAHKYMHYSPIMSSLMIYSYRGCFLAKFSSTVSWNPASTSSCRKKPLMPFSGW